MSVYNRRLFFNRGGYAHRGTGITSGLTPVQKFQTGGQVDPMDKWRSAVYSGMMTAKSKQPGAIGSFLDVMGQSMGAATELLPDPKDIKDRKIIKGADGYQYYVDTGDRVLPDVVKANERKNSEKYNTYLDLVKTGYTGSFEDYLKSTEVIKPEKKVKHFWAVDIATGEDLRTTDDEFDSATMKKGKPDRQGEGDKYIDVYDEKLEKMIRIQNDEFDSKIHRRDPPKLEANDKYTTNYKDYLKTLENPDLATGPDYLEFLNRNKKAQITKGPTTYEEYARTTDDPTPQGYLEYLEKFKLDQPKSYQEYLLTDDTPTTKEFGEFLDKRRKSGFTTDYKNYLNTLDSPDQATGPGFAAFLDKKLQKTQADKDYWVWSKEDEDWLLIKGSEFDASKHSKEPLNQAMFLTGDQEFSGLVEDKVAMMLNDMKGKINPATNLVYTNAEMNEIVFDEVSALLDQRLEALASEQPQILSLEDEISKKEGILKAVRDDKEITKWIEGTNARGENAGGKLAQYKMMDFAQEDAIIGKIFQPQREWIGALVDFLGWNDEETYQNMSDTRKRMVDTLTGFIGGNIASTDVVRAITNLGVLANAENGALPGNLNLKEFQTLQESYAALVNSKEGFNLIIQLYQRDAEIDQLRYEAWQNHSLGKKLEGRLFGDESFEGLDDGEAILKISKKIKELQDSMITGNEERGWSDLSEQFDAVKSKAAAVTSWRNVDDLNIKTAVKDKGLTEFTINLTEREENGKVRLLGYSDADGRFTYNTDEGLQTFVIQAGPNVPVYEIDTGRLKPNDMPLYIVKGFRTEK